MDIGKFMSSVLPSFTKGRIREDISVLRDEMRKVTLPGYKLATAKLDKKFHAEEVIQFDKLFQQNVDTKFRGNYLEVTYQALQRLDEKLDMLEGMVERYFADDLFREGMTFLKANIIQYLELMGFTARYARHTLVWATTKEVEAGDPSLVSEDAFVPAELEWLQANRDAFFRGITLMAGERIKAEEALNEVPDVTVNERSIGTVTQNVGILKTDPFALGLIPTWLNPIYHIRMAVAEWQVSRYKAAEEEARMVEFRLMQLKLQKEGKKDARLQQQIEYTEGRLQKLRAKLADMEESYG